MLIPIIAVSWLLLAILLFIWVQNWRARAQVQARLYDVTLPQSETAADEMSWLSRWLFLAGYRSEQAPTLFLLSQALALCLGIAALTVLYSTGMVRQALRLVSQLPDAFGALFVPVFYAAPWVIFVVLVSLPYLVVARARKQRVEEIEQDLPVLLELLSTLAEAGLAFDAALDEILETQPTDRPLTIEWRLFQRDILSGRSRLQSLKRLGHRVEVLSLTILVSSLVQAEQLGSSLTQALRNQSNDLRNRRRERALAQATALPVKLLIPLIVGFLPGIFILTLGPAFYQLFRSLEGFLRPS